MGRKHFRDPDVLALEASAGGLIDARTLVIATARDLVRKYDLFETGQQSRFERLCCLAKFVGFDVQQMTVTETTSRDRAAAILMNGSTSGKQGVIVYDPRPSNGRVLFSVAHEIAHTFFPNTNGGARFRESLAEDAAEMSELERLCDLGASELLMPLGEFQRRVNNWTVASVSDLAPFFGASLEATLYRLATAYRGDAVAGLARFRRIKAQEEELRLARQGMTLLQRTHMLSGMPDAKYRRQSLHQSGFASESVFIPWNKSFDSSSVVYRPGTLSNPATEYEYLPNNGSRRGVMEAVVAPFQRPDTPEGSPDVLFFWKAA